MSFKICIVGCGSHSTLFHGPSYARYAGEHNQVVLAACCDRQEHKARDYANHFGFRKYDTDMDEMLLREEPDAVCLIAPVELTCSLAVRILEKGYPLMLEKPPGLTRRETLQMIEAADKKKVPNQVAFNRRYFPLAVRLKQILDCYWKNSDINYIKYEFFRSGRTDDDFSTTAIHGIDMVRHLAGSDYSHIDFAYQEVAAAKHGTVNIYMNAMFQSGAVSQLSFCPVAGTVIERASINVYDHSLFVSLPVWGALDSPGQLLHLNKNRIVLNLSGAELADSDQTFVSNGFYDENRSFFDDIQAGRFSDCNLATCLQSVDVMECVRDRRSTYRKT